ncbi:MAG: hypothetical protein J5U19_08520 [Candidatus Methanoperedens sp.]|nr:hypothetical protein [Candidatus Methanoperedens sp.]
MSKVNNVLGDLRNKVGIAGKRIFAEAIIEIDDYIAKRYGNAVQFMSVELCVVQKSFLVHWLPGWL